MSQCWLVYLLNWVLEQSDSDSKSVIFEASRRTRHVRSGPTDIGWLGLDRPGPSGHRGLGRRWGFFLSRQQKGDVSVAVLSWNGQQWFEAVNVVALRRVSVLGLLGQQLQCAHGRNHLQEVLFTTNDLVDGNVETHMIGATFIADMDTLQHIHHIILYGTFPCWIRFVSFPFLISSFYLS